MNTRGFPDVGGVVVGLVTGTAALFTPVSTPGWVTFKIVLVVATFGFAAANLIGLLIKRRRSRRDRQA